MRRLVNPDRARGQADVSAAAASRSVGDNAARGEAARGAQSSVRRGPSHGTHKFSASCILLTHRAGRHRHRHRRGGRWSCRSIAAGSGSCGGPGGKAKGAPSRASAQRDGGRLQRGGHGGGCRPPRGAAPRPRGSRGGPAAAAWAAAPRDGAGSPPPRASAVNPQQPRDGSRNMGTLEWTNTLSYRYKEKIFCKAEATAKHSPTSMTFLRQAGSRKIVFSL